MVRFICFLCLCLSALSVQAASIIAQVDRNPVGLGEAVVLSFTANGVVNAEPDFSPLKQDFELRGRSQSNSISVVNGVSDVQTTWELTLYPLKTGTMHIPAIAFGADSSQALDLQVTDQAPAGGSNTPNTASDVLLEITVEPRQPYVQQQVIVTQRLYYIGPLQQTWQFKPPPVEAGKGTLQQIGGYTNSIKTLNGRNYKVIEARYLLVPQQSGELVLGRASFEGMMDDYSNNNNRFNFDPFGDPFGLLGKPVKRFSQPITLQVQAQPKNFNGKQWLPAKSVELHAYWKTPPNKLKTGEPVTLTLAIVADGLTAEQLPKLDLPVPTGLKAYASQPEFRNQGSGDSVLGTRQENWTVISPYNGDFDLPAITLDWWNIKTNKLEKASLDAVKLSFRGGQAAPASASNALPPKTAPTQPKSANSPEPNAAVPAKPVSNGFSWGYIALTLLGLWVVATLAWFSWRWWQKKIVSGRAKAPLTQQHEVPDAKLIWQRLEQAALNNQPQATHDALLQWLDVGLNIRPALLSTLRAQADATLQTEIDALNTALYGRSAYTWNGKGLLQALQSIKTLNPTKAKTNSGLVTLYPE